MKTDGWHIFKSWCLSAKNEKNLSLLFDLLLTHEERIDIASRCLIISELIKQEKTQREIAEIFNVSIAKITRGSNELKRTPEKLIEFLKESL